jgi:hypothetical protein
MFQISQTSRDACLDTISAVVYQPLAEPLSDDCDCEPVLHDFGCEPVLHDCGCEPVLHDCGCEPVLHDCGCEPVLHDVINPLFCDKSLC